MNENQISPKPGYQQNQPLQGNLTDDQSQPGSYEKEDSEIRDRNSQQQEFPERNHQHDYKTPSAGQNEDDEEDDVDTDEENPDKDNTTKNFPAEKQTDVSNLGLV